MRHFLPGLLLFSIALGFIAAGCGGGGGGGGTNGGSGQLVMSPGTATLGPNGEVTLYATVNGSPVDVTWSSSSGFVTPVGLGLGVLTAPSSGTVTVTATRTSGSGSDTSSFTISPGLATVRGRVVDQDSLLGISGATIQFKNGTTTLSSVTSYSGGYFVAAVSPAANRFHMPSSPFPSGYYKQYTYNSKRYTALVSTCSATLPSLVAGGAHPLVDTIKLPVASGPPPPPPNGCGP